MCANVLKTPVDTCTKSIQAWSGSFNSYLQSAANKQLSMQRKLSENQQRHMAILVKK